MGSRLYCDDCMEDFDASEFGYNNDELDYQDQLIIAKDAGWQTGRMFNFCPDCQEEDVYE